MHIMICAGWFENKRINDSAVTATVTMIMSALRHNIQDMVTKHKRGINPIAQLLCGILWIILIPVQYLMRYCNFGPYISENTHWIFYCSVLKSSRSKLQESVMRNWDSYLNNWGWLSCDLQTTIQDRTNDTILRISRNQTTSIRNIVL